MRGRYNIPLYSVNILSSVTIPVAAMATFSAATFSSDRYASFRPTYPTSLFTEHLLPYHQGARKTLLDLGCGPGTVTRPLSAYFTHTIGADPSSVMLTTARALTPSTDYIGIEYRASAAEDLPFLADGEVDMVTAGQAAHWFDQPRWWGEMRRVVRKGGTVAAWGYRDFLFTEHPRASAVLRRYTYGDEWLGKCWSQPGRSVVEDRLRSIRPPAEDWEDVTRWEWEPEFEVEVKEGEGEGVRQPVLGDDGREGYGRLVKEREGLMRRTMKLGEVESYVGTWSCCHTWREKHPEAKSIADGGQGDILDELMEKMREAEGWGKDWREKQVDIAWGHGVILARRK